MTSRTLTFRLCVTGIIVALVPLAILWLVADTAHTRSIEHVSTDKIATLSLELSETGDLLITDFLRQTRLAALALSASTATPSDADRLSQGVAQGMERLIRDGGMDATSLCLLDGGGNVIARAHQGEDTGQIPLSANLPWIRSALSGTEAVAEPLCAAAGGPVFLPLAVPMPRGETAKNPAVLVAWVPMTTVSRHMVRTLGKRGYSYVLNRNGIVIAHPRPEYVLSLDASTDSVLGTLFTRFRSDGQQAAGIYRFEGIDKVGGLQTMKRTGWIMGVTQPLVEFREEALAGRLWLLLTTLLLVTGAGILTAALSRTLVIPLRQMAQALAVSSTHLLSASKEVVDSGTSLADSASQQASAVHETTTTLDNIVALSQKTSELTRGSKDMISENIRKSASSLKALMELTQKMSRIEADSDRIMSIIKTIDEIAFQTSLLALNAAVEAARAGETGAGFAVVAEEVKSLASRSTEAARDTQELLNTTVGRVTEASQAISDINKNFGDIIESATIMGEKIEAISVASDQQTQGLAEINEALRSLDDTTHHIAACSQEAASVSEELSGQARELGVHVAHLGHMVGMK